MRAMSLVELRNAFYSPVCDVNPEAYAIFVRNCRRFTLGCHGRLVGCVPAVGGAIEGESGVPSLSGGGRLRSIGGVEAPERSEDRVGGVCVCSEFVCSGHGNGDDSYGRGVDVGIGGLLCGSDGGDDARVGTAVVPGAGVDEELGSVEPVESGGVADVGVAVKVGKWRKKNLRKKQKNIEKENELRGAWRQPAAVVAKDKSEAQETLEAKWVVENKLKAAEARRKLQLLEMQDVSDVAKLQERKLKAAGERALVQIEKSHATLAATGNVPGVVPEGGYCTTIVDDPGLSDGSSPSCTISPDSSASMKEFKETQKKLLDFQKRCEDQQKEILVLKKKYRKEARGALDAGAEIALTWNFDDGPTDSVKEFVKEIPYEVEQDRDIVIGQITLKKDFEAFYADDGCGGEAFDF